MTRRTQLGALVGAAALLVTAATLQAREFTAPLRVLQWNVGTLNPWSMRLPASSEARVIDTIADFAPHVVTLQEVRSTSQVDRLRAGLAARGLRYEAHSLVVDASHPDGLLVILSREPVVARRTLSTRVGFACQAVNVGALWVVAIHAPTGSDPGPRARFFAEVLAWTAPLPGPCALAGDLNLGPHGGAGAAGVLPWLRRRDRATYQRLTAAFPTHTRAGSTTAYFMPLDHVLGRDVRLASQEVLKGRRRFPMDHDPVVVDVQVVSTRGLAGTVGAP